MAGTLQQRITPFLWFDDQAEDAVKFYVAVFNNSRILDTTRYTEANAPPTVEPVCATTNNPSAFGRRSVKMPGAGIEPARRLPARGF